MSPPASYANGAVLPVVPNDIPPSVYGATSSQRPSRSSTRVSIVFAAPSRPPTQPQSSASHSHPGSPSSLGASSARSRRSPNMPFPSRIFSISVRSGTARCLSDCSSEPRLCKSQQRILPLLSRGTGWDCIRGVGVKLLVRFAYHRRGLGD
ncbi:hypothetical protein FIBSPDRAFT_591511 [Athelia psychrophila]|uniref:Uncharacterized protein n=1 Tax=Athelia psychrophila TaxID=1759441 RepID=A0A166H330_9AGAM|nr:hypothetical protein FIBSPDRAFT_591511 [Fibularhizoctonia sp. CBS 109695]